MQKFISKFNRTFHKPTLIILTVVNFVIAASFAAATNDVAPPLRELTIATTPTNVLAASSIRLVPGKWTIDAVTFKPILEMNIESSADEVDSGVTNRVIIRRMMLNLNAAQINNWLGAANGRAFIEAALLNKTKLVRAP